VPELVCAEELDQDEDGDEPGQARTNQPFGEVHVSRDVRNERAKQLPDEQRERENPE